jgi:hypothetical protein
VSGANPAKVDFDQEVSTAREDRRVFGAGKLLQYVVDPPTDVDTHAGIITSAF